MSGAHLTAARNADTWRAYHNPTCQKIYNFG
jgi:hypothetical protein